MTTNMEAATEYSPGPNEKAQKTLTGSWEGESPVLPWILPEKIDAAISTLFLSPMIKGQTGPEKRRAGLDRCGSGLAK